MAQLSGYWTTGGTTGHQQASYSQIHLADANEIIAGCGFHEGVAKGYKNSFLSTVSGLNTISVGTGGAVVDGHWYYNDAALSVNIPSAVGTGNTRIDRIVIRCTWASFKAEITRLPGTDAASPTPPALKQSHGDVYDIPLYQAKVTTSGAVTLTDERKFAIPTDTIALHLKVFADEDNNEVGDGALYWTIPEELDGAKFYKCDIACTTPGTSGQTSIQVNINGSDSLSPTPKIDASEYSSYTGTRGLANIYVDTGARVRIDVDSVSTGSKGLEAILVFEK